MPAVQDDGAQRDKSFYSLVFLRVFSLSIFSSFYSNVFLFSWQVGARVPDVHDDGAQRDGPPGWAHRH